MAFPRSHNPRYITSALAIFDEDVKGEYTCTIHGDEFWANQIKDWYEGQ